MASRVVPPDVTVLKISNGDTLTVRKRLNTGERRDMLKRMSVVDPDGHRVMDSLLVGLSTVIAYLVDWSLTDDDGKVIPIRDQPAGVVQAALDELDPDDFKEIEAAIDAHDDAMEAERAAAKNPTDGEKNAPAISPSPSSAAGESSGSVS